MTRSFHRAERERAQGGWFPESDPRKTNAIFPLGAQRGFILAITILLILGVAAMSLSILYTNKMGRMSAINYKNKLQTFLASDGLITLLAQEAINGNGDKYVDLSRTGRIKGEIWYNLPGGNVRSFISLTRSDPTPDETIYSYYLGSSLNMDDYGVKWSGWLLPPLSGSYTFYTRSDDGSQFFLSTDDSEENLSDAPLCYQDGWVYSWPTAGTAVSRPITLIGGRRYYFEYYHKEWNHFEVGQIGWDGPEYFSERPITSRYLSMYRSDPDWSGTVDVGGIPVRYNMSGTSMDAYRISAEAVKLRPGASRDTAFRAPLTQNLSMKGAPAVQPNKMWLRVIHYDFPSDGGSSEFNMNPYTNALFTDIVEHKLTDFTTRDAAYFGRSTIPKPRHYRASNSFSCGVGHWFREWTPTFNTYAYSSGDECATLRFDPSGDNWRNRKYYDSLEFKLDPTQGPNTYVYSRMGNYDSGDPRTSWRGDTALYFPLDKYGDDPPGSGHNFGFCTELHTTFIYQSGMKFEFTGDDDVWVFVNDSLVIDLGGVHIALNSVLHLDHLRNLQFGKTYNFDFFQCERHESHSTSRMVTNIKMQPPRGAPTSQWRRSYSIQD